MLNHRVADLLTFPHSSQCILIYFSPLEVKLKGAVSCLLPFWLKVWIRDRPEPSVCSRFVSKSHLKSRAVESWGTCAQDEEDLKPVSTKWEIRGWGERGEEGERWEGKEDPGLLWERRPFGVSKGSSLKPIVPWELDIHGSLFYLQPLVWWSSCVLPYVAPCCAKQWFFFFWLCFVLRYSILRAIFLFHFVKRYICICLCVCLFVCLAFFVLLFAIYVQVLEEAIRGP